MEFPVFDLHCDTALALLGTDMRGGGSLLKNSGQIDLMRAKQLSGYCQCFACFTTTLENEFPIAPVDVFERELAVVLREIERNAELITQAYSAQEVEKNAASGKMSAILTIEGPAGFGFDPGLLTDLYNIGFRITTLGWNEDNVLTGSHMTGGGLTSRGREYVRQAQNVGMLVDVSHISDRGFWDIMEITQKPIIASHSNSRKICDISRNITDEMFLAICNSGGVCGINQYSEFLGEHPTLDTVCDHILHFMELDPDGTHIALGGDLDGCDTLSDGFYGIESYPALAQRLIERGVLESEVYNIFWNNAIGVMNSCCI